MRSAVSRWATLALLASLVWAPDRASADRTPAAVELSPELRERLVVLHDGHGHFVVVEPFGDSANFFYGDDAALHRQRVFGFFQDRGRGASSRRFWSPRSENNGDLELENGRQWTVRCDDRKTPLVVADDATAARVLGKAKFYESAWQRQAYALARDEDGNYYYVDKLRDRYAEGYRLFVGKRGSMRERPLEDVVSDSGGDIFATRRGDFRLVRNRGSATSLWVHGKRRLELTTVPPEKNVVLIYADLGVYRKSLGTPCDEL